MLNGGSQAGPRRVGLDELAGVLALPVVQQRVQRPGPGARYGQDHGRRRRRQEPARFRVEQLGSFRFDYTAMDGSYVLAAAGPSASTSTASVVALPTPPHRTDQIRTAAAQNDLARLRTLAQEQGGFESDAARRAAW